MPLKRGCLYTSLFSFVLRASTLQDLILSSVLNYLSGPPTSPSKHQNIIMSATFSRRNRNAIRDSDLPKKRLHSDHEVHEPRNAKETTRSESEKPTASLEEAELLMGAANIGNIAEEQVVYLTVNDGDTIHQQDVHQEQDQVMEEPQQPELTEEELRKELQALLDSQLSGHTENDDDERHLIRSRDQLEMQDDTENDTQETGDPPAKSFTTNEIQLFIDNQIKRQHQQQIIEEQFQEDSTHNHGRSGQQTQQHLILVTQNGDKIILIQNPNEMESEDGEGSGMDYIPPEFTEEQEIVNLMRNKHRQQLFMNQLHHLREIHQKKLPSNVTTPAVPHMQPIKLVPIDSGDDSNAGGDGPEDLFASMMGKTSSATKTRNVVKKPFVRKREGEGPKWFRPVNNYLNLAIKYVKRREEKVEEVAKSFPSASSSFEKRCKDMKQDFTKVELAIERFQNTIGKELEDATQKFQSFLRDYHLEGSIGELEAEDEVDEFDSNMFEPDLPGSDKPKTYTRKVKKNLISGEGTSGMQIITPANISITSATASEEHELEATHVIVNQEEEDPFEFKQESEEDVVITPVSTNTSITMQQEEVSPKKSGRLQTRKRPDPPVLRTPSARTKKPTRR